VDWPKACVVVIPCYNEAEGIGDLVREVQTYLPRIIVVDDGSVDATASLARTTGAQVLRHTQNKGKGAALKTGLAAALEQGGEWALTMDGDGQHRPGDIPLFLALAENAGAALVVGDRMHNARAIPWARRWTNRWMSRRLSLRTGRTLPDTQCGYRLINLRAWASLRLLTEHFEVESEMLMAFLDAGCPVAFVPIQAIGRGARSRIHPLIDAWRWWKWWRLSGP